MMWGVCVLPLKEQIIKPIKFINNKQISIQLVTKNSSGNTSFLIVNVKLQHASVRDAIFFIKKE